MITKTYLLVAILILAMNSTASTETLEAHNTVSNNPQPPQSDWKCGDKVREIPTGYAIYGKFCIMLANIGYHKNNYGGYYTWEEATSVCEKTFGDGWVLPTKTDITNFLNNNTGGMAWSTATEPDAYGQDPGAIINGAHQGGSWHQLWTATSMSSSSAYYWGEDITSSAGSTDLTISGWHANDYGSTNKTTGSTVRCINKTYNNDGKIKTP